MFRYSQFDLITKTSKKTKFIIKLVINIIIISFILLIFLINIDTKDDVKFISSNSRRIINNLHNYTETMSDFIVSGSNINDNNNNNQIEELNEIKNIRLSIDYFKELKEKEIKELKELKELEKLKELKEIKELEELKEREIKKEKAINLIKFYINDYYNSSIHLIPSYSKVNGYSENNQCLLELININNDELFNRLIKIDYEKSEVSFNYLDENEEYYKNTDNIIETHIYTNYDKNNRFYKYSHYIYRNFKENIIKNPIYQTIKNNLEIDYSYTEPNPTEEYNNKSKYFSESLNEFSETIKHINTDYFKNYYENYYNDTYYLNYYTKDENNMMMHYEYLINNEIIMNNPNSIDIYSKHPYKYKCSSNINTPKPIIKNYYSYSIGYTDYPCYASHISLNELENILNIDYYNEIISRTGWYNFIDGNFNINVVDKDFIYNGNDFRNTFYNINKYSYELEKNKGSRMIKHNLTNIMINPINSIYFRNHYFIEKVFIDFPLISNIIYDEYDYIKQILSNIANIYELPIIPPIKFN